MLPITTSNQVFEVVQHVKGSSTDFCTNLYISEARLQAWIKHGEVFLEQSGRTAFFLRRDQDCWHLYYCAGSYPELEGTLRDLTSLKAERVVMDLVGQKETLDRMAVGMKSAGFRTYARLQRMSRPGLTDLPESWAGDARTRFAESADQAAIVELLNQSFDHFADQLPRSYEIQAAIERRQMLSVKCESQLASLLFFETQGFTSTLRYWVVAEAFRARRLGSCLMRAYFAGHRAVRRFVLWVVDGNEEAIQKYRHYGYAPDGLANLVLANELVPS